MVCSYLTGHLIDGIDDLQLDGELQLTRGDRAAAQPYLGRFQAHEIAVQVAAAPADHFAHAEHLTDLDAVQLGQLARFGKQEADRGILLPRTDVTSLDLRVYVDASGGSPDNPYPQTGWVFVVKGCAILWRSVKQKRVARSTMRAERKRLSRH